MRACVCAVVAPAELAVCGPASSRVDARAGPAQLQQSWQCVGLRHHVSTLMQGPPSSFGMVAPLAPMPMGSSILRAAAGVRQCARTGTV